MTSHSKLFPLSTLKGWERNPRKHPKEQVAALAGVMRRFGLTNLPILATYPGNPDGFINAGNGRLAALRLLHEQTPKNPPVGVEVDGDDWLIPVRPVAFVSKNEAEAAALSDNWIAEMPGVEDDREILRGLLAELDADETPLDGLGVEDIDALAASLAGEEPDGTGGTDEGADDLEPEGEPDSKPGEVYELGPHRLVCGDSTKAETVKFLLQGQKADMVFSDPPYGMRLDADYSKMSSSFKGIDGGNKYENVIGDHEDFSPSLIITVFENFAYCKDIFLWGADYYSDLLPNRNEGSWIVWDKRGDESADKMFGSVFELCWSKRKHKREIARIKWAGIFGISKEHDKQRTHPTQKPSLLAEWFFKKWGNIGDIVVDLYGGSGSTLIACAKTGRIARLIELDPRYCDVIRRRWTKYALSAGVDPGPGRLD